MQNLEKILQKYCKPVLIAIFMISVLLRWLYLPQNAISFAYDQARDAFVVQEIINGDFKILGPSVSGVPGLFHGVLYYYVVLLPYLIGQGNPVYVAYFMSFVSSLVVLLVFYLSYLLTKKYTPSIIASLLFAFSYEASQYANLLTNASMGVWFVPLIYIAILLGSPILLGLSFGLAVQSEIALLYHLVPIIVLTYQKYNIKKYFLFLFTFLISISSLLISEFKFGFSGTRGLLYLLTGGDGISNTKTLSDYFITSVNQLGLTFAYSIFPMNIVFGGLVGFILVYLLIKNKEYWSKLLIVYIFAFAFALPFGGWNMKHLLVGLSPAVSVTLGIVIWKHVPKKLVLWLVCLTVILGANLFMILKENKNGQTIFPLQEDLVLSKELKVIDYTYQKSQGKPFSISTLTSPLFVNTLWSYLYNWYGIDRYGYLPSFVGRDQIGQLGNNLSTIQPSNNSSHYYIEEPTYGIPEIYVQYARGDEESYSKLLEFKNFDKLRVEKREYKNE